MSTAKSPIICMLLRSDVTHNLRVRKQAQTLTRAGWDVTVVALAVGDQPVGPEIDGAGFTIWRIRDSLSRKTVARSPEKAKNGAIENSGKPRAASSSTPRRLLQLIRLIRLIVNRIMVMLRMMRVIRQVRPDMIESHNVNTLPAGYIGSRLAGAALVYDAHEINIEREGYYARIRTLIYQIEKFVVPRAKLVMSTTDLRSEHYQRTYRLVDKPLVIQNKPRYSSAERNDYLRRTCNIPDDDVVVLYQGGLQEGRGLHNLVRAASTVRDATFVFLGNGAQEDSLRELARSLEVSNVRFHAAVPLESLPSVTASADIGMQVLRNTCLNHYTTDSNKIFEYGMGGLAVVASDFPEIRRIIEAHKYGLLVDPDRVEEIAAAVQRLVYDDELRVRLQKSAESSRRALSWESQESAYLAAMTRVLEHD